MAVMFLLFILFFFIFFFYKFDRSIRNEDFCKGPHMHFFEPTNNYLDL
jgi:hypothetical protein